MKHFDYSYTKSVNEKIIFIPRIIMYVFKSKV